MNRLIEQPLESSRYFATNAEEACVCCGVAYAGNGPYCVRCAAPLALSHTVRQRGTPPRFIPVLGASGAGKTVYLGMLLDILSKGAHGIAGLVTGSFSARLQTQAATALEHRCFPEKTPVEAEGWQWVHCEVSAPKAALEHWVAKAEGRGATRAPGAKLRGKKAARETASTKSYADIITPDFAGESIAQEIAHPGTFPAIQHVLQQAQGLLVLCDSWRVRDVALGEDLFAMQLASYLVQQHERAAGGAARPKLQVPLAIVLTKSDECPEACDDPAGFAQNNLPRLWQFCQRRFARYRFFASSVVGSRALLADSYGRRRQIPFHIEPRGILEPLIWIIGA